MKEINWEANGYLKFINQGMEIEPNIYTMIITFIRTIFRNVRKRFSLRSETWDR